MGVGVRYSRKIKGKRVEYHIMRILVGVKRVIDYAVKVSVFSVIFW